MSDQHGIATLRKYFQQHPTLLPSEVHVFLVGSRVRGDFNNHSNYDLVFWPQSYRGTDVINALWNDLRFSAGVPPVDYSHSTFDANYLDALQLGKSSKLVHRGDIVKHILRCLNDQISINPADLCFSLPIDSKPLPTSYHDFFYDLKHNEFKLQPWKHYIRIELTAKGKFMTEYLEHSRDFRIHVGQVIRYLYFKTHPTNQLDLTNHDRLYYILNYYQELNKEDVNCLQELIKTLGNVNVEDLTMVQVEGVRVLYTLIHPMLTL